MTTYRNSLYKAYQTTLVEILEIPNNWEPVERSLVEQIERGGVEEFQLLNTTTLLRGMVDHKIEDWSSFTDYIFQVGFEESVEQTSGLERELLELLGKTCQQVEFL